MPISKRNKQVELSKTKKQGLERKKKLHEEIRSCVDKYEHIFVFSVSDMRNSKMKNVRDQWKHSRFFIGKNKVMAMALGRALEEEYQPNLHKVGQMLKGQCGLLFSNQPVDEVLSWFRSYSAGVFARSGNIATADVVLKEGPLSQFPHSLEPELRRLGLPTTLTKGIVHLFKDHEVCKEGDTLTPEAAKVLEHLGYEMAEFQIKIQCVWSRDGTFMDLRTELPDEEGSSKKKRRRSRSRSKKRHSKAENSAIIEVMEITELDAEQGNDEARSETELALEESKENIEHKKKESSTELALEESKENIEHKKKESSTELALEESKENIEHKKKESSTELALEESKENIEQKRKESSFFEISPNAKNVVVDEEMEVVELDEPVKEDIVSSGKERKQLFEQNCSTPIGNGESVCNTEEVQESVREKSFVYALSPEKTVKKVETDDEIGSRRSRPRKRKGAVKMNVSLQSEVDIANSSQDSPVFRELRNRSVKFSSKKNKK